MKIKLLQLVIFIFGFSTSMGKSEVTLPRSEYNFREEILPLFGKFCVGCHGPKKEKGGVRITDLDPDLINGHDGDKWYGMLDVINLGEMPPENKPQPTDEERRKIVDWLTVELKYASEIKAAEVKPVLRRLNKQQYTNTLKELLQIDMDFGKDLPNDGLSHEGFANNGETLTMSTLHIESYMKIARQALDKAIVTGKAPKIHRFKITLGKNISQESGKVELGYQSIPLQKSDYLLQTLAPENKNFDAQQHIFKTNFNFSNSKGTKWKIESSASLYDTFYIDMRGSNRKRFNIVEDGIILQSSIPHIEKAAKIWQGPAPNLKVVMRDFPKYGDFRVTIEASKAPFIAETPRYLNIQNIKPVASFDSKAFKISAIPGSVIINAKKPLTHKNLSFGTNCIHTKKACSEATYKFKIKPGLYQLDIVYSAKYKRPLDLKINNFTIHNVLNSSTGGWHEFQLFSQAALKFETEEVTLSFESKRDIPHVNSFIFSPIDPLSKLAQNLIETLKGKNPNLANYNPYIRVFMGNRLNDGMEYKTFDKAQKVTALYGDSQKLHFHGRLEDMPLPVIDKNDTTFLANMALFGMWNDSFSKTDSDQGEPALIKSIEFEGPYFENWPPQSHTNIFFNSQNSSNKEVYTKEILSRFIYKAFRRKAKQSEINRFFNFWKDNHRHFNTYEESIKELLVAVLCSPSFLYLTESNKNKQSGTLNDFELASRLSYFLWDTMPDERLLNLAERNKLKENLSAEVSRMIKDPRSFNFSKVYSEQWLDLHKLDEISVNISMYPSFTRYIKEDMAKETQHFFHEILTKNLNILNFVDSDFVMINQNLAQFYGIPNVKGSEFRNVSLPRSMQRGGLLSQGSFLTGHSSGEDSHPIKRGVWLIEKITDNPPPEAPPNVPIPNPEDPEFAKLSKKQLLEKHRDNASCRDCHRKIDPWGVPFEEYDAIGLLVTKKDKRLAVDSKSVLSNGQKINGITELKDYILKYEADNVNRSVTKHLLSYALGRSLSFTDNDELNKILEKSKKNDYKMQSIIEGIVTSKLFTKR